MLERLKVKANTTALKGAFWLLQTTTLLEDYTMIAPPLHMAAASGLFRFLGRREINACVAADPTLAWRDSHPGRLIHACNQRDVLRLRALLENGRAPYGWPRVRYECRGRVCEASNLFEAACNAHCQEAALIAVSYMDVWTPAAPALRAGSEPSSGAGRAAAHAIAELANTTWTVVADALVDAGGRTATLEHLWSHTDAVLCYGTGAMAQWFAQLQTPSLHRQTALQHLTYFMKKDRIAMLLSLGYMPDPATVATCFARYRHYREEDPEGSGDRDAMDILRLLIPHAAMRTLHDGKTPMMRLVSEVWGRGDLLALMLEHGADPVQQDVSGRTALWWAENTRVFGEPCHEYVVALR